MTTPTIESFLDNVKSHEITINLDEGLYRDITIKNPNNINAHYNITTRPDYLMFSGDMGCYVFRRLEDMFNFFRCSKDGEYYISPHYWSEKVQAESIFGEGINIYDEKVAKESLNSELENHIEYLESLLLDEDEDDSEIQEKINSARNAIKDIDCSNIYSLVESIRNWDEDDAGGLSLCDFWENSTESYSYYYIWCCYAIVHAIKLYDEAKAK